MYDRLNMASQKKLEGNEDLLTIYNRYYNDNGSRSLLIAKQADVGDYIHDLDVDGAINKLRELEKFVRDTPDKIEKVKFYYNSYYENCEFYMASFKHEPEESFQRRCFLYADNEYKSKIREVKDSKAIKDQEYKTYLKLKKKYEKAK